MIDLHCHLLPGIDDGAPDLDAALAMAEMAVADGTRVTACTPHIYPGLYDNDGPGIQKAVVALRIELENAAIPLQITYGADTHLAPDLVTGLRTRRVPSLHGSRYFLLEPPHHVAPQGLERFVSDLLAAGYVPLITHPERLTWVAKHYELFQRLVAVGAWIQLTAGSLTGRFGAAPRYWGERFLRDGLTHVLATDAHSLKHRPPLLSEGFEAAARLLGEEQATHLVRTRPRGVLDNRPPDELPSLPVPRRMAIAMRGFKRFWQRRA